jgi:trk system potassium uptake protein TrkA
MNIIIVGAGEIGRYLATWLSKETHRISVIESNPRLAEDLEQSIDAKVICSDGASASALAEANIGECELFLALTSSNTVNLTCASMAKDMGVGKVVCRVHPSLERESWLCDYRKDFGIDHMFSSARISAIELAKFVRNPDSEVVEELARGKIEVLQVEISEDSNMINRTLEELKPPPQVRVALIYRENLEDEEEEEDKKKPKEKYFVPRAKTKLKAGDIATVFGEPRKLRDFVDRLRGGKGKPPAPRVVIFSGGEYGFSLARMLESWDFKVRIFERDENLCRQLADQLENTTIINADATVLADLEEEQVGEADFFIATSPDDEDNVMTCLQANSLGTKACLTIIHRADYADAISNAGKHFGVRAAISPREATRREIERFITSDRFHVIKDFEGGELIEMPVAENSKAAGRTVDELNLPDRCVLVGRQHGLHVTVPTSETRLEANDLIYAVVAPKARRRLVKLLK